MKRRSKSKKKKSAASFRLAPEEETLITTLLNDFPNIDPAELVARIPKAPLALTLVERLPLDDERCLPLLAAINKAFDHKKVRRAVKQALYRLEKKGISVRMFSRDESPPTAILKPAEKEKPALYLGPMDLTGTRAVLIILQRAAKALDVWTGIVSDSKGIPEFVFGSLSKKRVRAIKEQITQNAGPLVDASLSHVATVMETAYQRHLEIHSNGPADYLELRPWLLENASLLTRPVIYDLIPAESVPEAPITNSKLAGLFRHRLMASWFIDFESLRPFMEELVKIDDSPIVLTELQKSSRSSEIKEKATKKLFPASERDALSKRFEEMAYVFYRLDEKDTALLSLAAARALDKEDPLVNTNPVITFLMDRSLGYYMGGAKDSADAGQPADDDSPRIILP